ncbi:MAG: neutral zinc metallopeptidase, partial [Jatrophihabitans sp.]
DDFGSDRVFTDEAFTSQKDEQNNGNSAYSDTIQYVEKTLPRFWTAVFSQLLSKSFTAPQVAASPGQAPKCDGSASRELGYCASDTTVYFDEKDLTKPAYKIGDWSVATAISLPYALAARSQLGKSTDDEAATRSAACLTGWYTARTFDGDFSDTVSLSPGDVDEGVRFLLTYGVSDQVFPNTHESGFELFRSFRDGFAQGGKACDIGI